MTKKALKSEPVSTWNGKRGVVIHIACVWVCSGFTSGSAKVLGGEERLPKDTQGTLETSLKENQSNMQWNSIKDVKKLKKINWKCNEILLRISCKSFWRPHWLHFGVLWASSSLPRSFSAPYGAPEVPFVSIWLPFGSILPPFLVHFGSIFGIF